MDESAWLWGALIAYAAGTGIAWRHGAAGLRDNRWLLLAVVIAVLCYVIAISERWLRIGHGPFLNMFEILLSNGFSLGFIYALAYWRIPNVRASAVAVLPVLCLIALWALMVPRGSGNLPATYDNPWLWVHVTVGKIFLGTCLTATGLAVVLLLRRLPVMGVGADSVGKVVDALAWKFLAVAFVFHSLMLIAGAVWAQDAWGRYWAWDPLETWAFLTWLAMALLLHLRVTYELPARLGWSAIVVVFVLAFMTFFGVPFISTAPHKGAV